MNNRIVHDILVQYGIEAIHILEPQKGYRNESHPLTTSDGTQLNLIIFKREHGMLARVRRADAISDYLHSQGFNTRQTYDQRITQLKNTHNIGYARMYYYLPGSTISWEAYNQKHLKLLGKTMSDMHHSLNDAPHSLNQVLPSVITEYTAILSAMKGYMQVQTTADAVAAKLKLSVDTDRFAVWRHMLFACKTIPQQQALHMDFVRSNILFEDSLEARISGVLDFEKTAFGPPIFDIARTLAFLLVDCKYKTNEQVIKYFLHSGYIKRGKALFRNPTIKKRTVRTQLLDELVLMFLCYDFYKFLKHNPYESLRDNEHYMRTQQLLVTAGVLRSLV